MRTHRCNKMLIPAVLAAVFSLPAMANDQYSDSARVLSVVPQTERVNMPRQECNTEYQQQNYNEGNNHSITGAIIGGIAGGLLGNTIGRGNGRVAATAVGAGVGAIAGNRIGSNHYNNSVNTRSAPVQSCYQVDNWQTVNAGYLVNYAYNGRTYSTVMDQDPGQYINVDVAVSNDNRPVRLINYNEPTRYYDSSWNNGRNRHDYGKHHGWNKHDRDDDD